MAEYTPTDAALTPATVAMALAMVGRHSSQRTRENLLLSRIDVVVDVSAWKVELLTHAAKMP